MSHMRNSVLELTAAPFRGQQLPFEPSCWGLDAYFVGRQVERASPTSCDPRGVAQARGLKRVILGVPQNRRLHPDDRCHEVSGCRSSARLCSPTPSPRLATVRPANPQGVGLDTPPGSSPLVLITAVGGGEGCSAALETRRLLLTRISQRAQAHCHTRSACYKVPRPTMCDLPRAQAKWRTKFSEIKSK